MSSLNNTISSKTNQLNNDKMEESDVNENYIFLLKYFSIMLFIMFIYSSDIFFFDQIDIHFHNVVCLKETNKIIISNKITDFPNNTIISYHSINCSIPESNITLIKFYHHLNDLEYLKGYYPGFDDDVNNMPYNVGIYHYIELCNLFVSFGNTFVTTNFEFIDNEPNPALKFIRYCANGSLIGSYKEVISLGHKYTYIFSHWFYDVLAPLQLFPNDIIKKCKIIVIPDNYNVHVDTLFALNFKPEQFIIMNEGDYIYAEKIYTVVHPLPHVSHFGLTMYKLSQKFRSFFNLSNIIPSKYCFSNRSGRRKITNFNEIVQAAKTKFPDYNISVVEDSKNISSIVKIWSNAKFMFMGTGSNFIKHLFMKENSVLCVGLANYKDNCIAFSAASHKVFTFYFVIVGMDHHCNYSGHPCDVNLAIKVCEIGLYLAKHGQWPNLSTN